MRKFSQQIQSTSPFQVWSTNQSTLVNKRSVSLEYQTTFKNEVSQQPSQQDIVLTNPPMGVSTVNKFGVPLPLKGEEGLVRCCHDAGKYGLNHGRQRKVLEILKGK
jgi:hypothetical protein